MSKLKFLVLSFIILALIYALPRLLIEQLGPNNPWTSFFYIYVLGGLFFVIGLALAISSASIRLDLKSDQFWFRSVILGFLFFASLHGTWIYFALNGPQYLN